MPMCCLLNNSIPTTLLVNNHATGEKSLHSQKGKLDLMYTNGDVNRMMDFDNSYTLCACIVYFRVNATIIPCLSILRLGPYFGYIIPHLSPLSSYH